MKKLYIIIYEHSYDRLEERVSLAMEQGYRPHGSLVFRPALVSQVTKEVLPNQKSAFIQPMVYNPK